MFVSLVASQIARADSGDGDGSPTVSSLTDVNTVGFGPSPGSERAPDLFRMAHLGELPKFPFDGSPANVTSTVLKGLVWDGLTAFDETKGTAVPAVALSWRSADDREWRFTLNEGAEFGDGTAIQAADVVYTLQSAAVRPANSLAAQELASSLARADGSNSIRPNAIRAASPLVVVITLGGPDAELPLLLANADLGIVPAGSLEPDADRTMDSSGPYSMPQPSTGAGGNNPSSAVVDLEANRESLRFKRIEVRPFGAVQDAYDALERGELEWSPVPSSQADEAIAEYGPDGENQARTLIGLTVNSKSPALADVKVRRALFQALNVNDMVAVFGSRATIALSVAPREFSVIWESDACLDGCRHDPKAAAPVLKRALGAKPTLKVDTFDTPEGRRLAAVVTEQLKAVGIATSVRVTAVDAYGTAVTRPDTQLMISGTTAVTPSAAAFIREGYASTGGANISGLSSKKVDELIAKTLRTSDAKERAALYGEAEKLIRSDAVMYPIAQIRSATVFADGVQGAWLGLDESMHFGDGN